MISNGWIAPQKNKLPITVAQFLMLLLLDAKQISTRQSEKNII